MSDFFGMIANLDKNIGQMLQFTNDQGLNENTIFLFMTDNGAAAGESTMSAQFETSQGKTLGAFYVVAEHLNQTTGFRSSAIRLGSAV